MGGLEVANCDFKLGRQPQTPLCFHRARRRHVVERASFTSRHLRKGILSSVPAACPKNNVIAESSSLGAEYAQLRGRPVTSGLSAQARLREEMGPERAGP